MSTSWLGNVSVNWFKARRSSRSAQSALNTAGMLPFRLSPDRSGFVTRFGSSTAAGTSQSATRPGLVGCGATVPFSQVGVSEAGWAPATAVRRSVAATAASSTNVAARAA